MTPEERSPEVATVYSRGIFDGWTTKVCVLRSKCILKFLRELDIFKKNQDVVTLLSSRPHITMTRKHWFPAPLTRHLGGLVCNTLNQMEYSTILASQDRQTVRRTVHLNVQVCFCNTWTSSLSTGNAYRTVRTQSGCPWLHVIVNITWVNSWYTEAIYTYQLGLCTLRLDF